MLAPPVFLIKSPFFYSFLYNNTPSLYKRRGIFLYIVIFLCKIIP
nr:MAG TPA: hypothetical protein [Caudoviricetes sp.]